MRGLVRILQERQCSEEVRAIQSTAGLLVLDHGLNFGLRPWSEFRSAKGWG